MNFIFKPTWRGCVEFKFIKKLQYLVCEKRKTPLQQHQKPNNDTLLYKTKHELRHASGFDVYYKFKNWKLLGNTIAMEIPFHNGFQYRQRNESNISNEFNQCMCVCVCDFLHAQRKKNHLQYMVNIILKRPSIAQKFSTRALFLSLSPNRLNYRECNSRYATICTN